MSHSFRVTDVAKSRVREKEATNNFADNEQYGERCDNKGPTYDDVAGGPSESSPTSAPRVSGLLSSGFVPQGLPRAENISP